jgi:hypothetical protein
MHVDGLIAAAQAHLPANKVTHGFHVSPSFKSAVAGQCAQYRTP